MEKKKRFSLEKCIVPLVWEQCSYKNLNFEKFGRVAV